MSNLKDTRLANKLSQKELSERSGVNLRMIQYYEQGVKDINKAEAMTVYKLSEALNCNVWELLEFEKPEEPKSFEGLTFKELLGE